MSGSIPAPSQTGGAPLTVNPMTGQLVMSGNSMAPAFSPGVSAVPTPVSAQPLAPPPAPSPIAAQMSAPQQPPASPAAPAAQPAPAAPAQQKLPQTPFTPYAGNISHYESGGGEQVGNGGGAFQFEPAELQEFEKENPQFAGQPRNSPLYQATAYSWLTTRNSGTLKNSGVDATAPGVNYAAFALNPAITAALAKAPDPSADATSFVKNMKGGAQAIAGNPALFAGNATIDDVFNRAQAIQTTGRLPNGLDTTSNVAQQQAASGSAPAFTPPPPMDGPQNLSDSFPNAPKLTPATSNPWIAAGAALAGGAGWNKGIGDALNAANAAHTQNMQTANDTAITQQNSALQTGQIKIETAKMGMFTPVLGQAGVRTTPTGDIFLSKNSFGQEQWQNATGQIVSPSGQPLSQTMAQQRMANSDAQLNARLLDHDRSKTDGTDNSGGMNPIDTPQVQPPAQQSPMIPGTSIPRPQPASQTSAPAQAQAAQAVQPVDPAAAAAAPFLQSMAAAPQQNVLPTIAKGYVAANQAAYDATQKAAVTATDANVAAEKALQAVNASPDAFPQSSAWGSFVSAVTSRLGYNPFGTMSNGSLQLSQAFLKQANSGGMGDLLHNAMGISRPSQMEVQMVQHAVANGSMPLSTLNQLMQSGINNNNSAIAEGRIAQAVWANGKYAAMPGAFTTAMTTAQSNLENGKYPDLYKPMVSLPPTNAAAGTPGAPQPGGGVSPPANSQQNPINLGNTPADQQKAFDALQSGQWFINPATNVPLQKK